MKVLQTKEQPQRTRNIYLRMSQIHDYIYNNASSNVDAILTNFVSETLVFFVRQGKNKNFLTEVKFVSPLLATLNFFTCQLFQ